ncbi:MAG: hypothetical protein WD407_03660 [Rhodospirillales bacterium]
MDILDPTLDRSSEKIRYVPRPVRLNGLRIGIIENTKKNAETVLRLIAERLEATHQMKLDVLVHKPQRAPLKDDQIDKIIKGSDFAVTGIGD